MKVKYLKELEDAIDKFEELEEQMALAAAQVRNAGFMVQEYLKEAEGIRWIKE